MSGITVRTKNKTAYTWKYGLGLRTKHCLPARVISSLINGIHFIDITYKKIVIANGREHVKNQGLFFSHERLRFS